jgi:hypothetical protein
MPILKEQRKKIKRYKTNYSFLFEKMDQILLINFSEIYES